MVNSAQNKYNKCESCHTSYSSILYGTYFDSYLEAKEEGWQFTRNPHFSLNGDLVAVCPKCVDQYNQEELENE